MLPEIEHPVFVNAALLPTPISPVVLELVQVTAGPPRMAKLITAPPDCAEELRAVTSSAPNEQPTAISAVVRGRVNMVFSKRVGGAGGGSGDPFQNRPSPAST